MDGGHATEFKPAFDLKRRHRVEMELRDVMTSAGIRLEDVSRGCYGFHVSDWTWQRLAEDLAERIDRGRLG